jgi:RNA polymerase sigma-70 factor (ECF subfamily)
MALAPPPAADLGTRDERWVDAALSADRDARGRALADIYTAYSRLVFKVAWNIVGSASETEDVVSETFVRAFERLDRLRDRRCLRTWLCQVARRTAIDRLRQRKTEVFDVDLSEAAEAGDAGEAAQVTRLTLEQVMGALRECASRLEESLLDLLWRRCAGYTPTLLAELHGRDEGELKRANDTLRYRLESCMEGKGWKAFRLKDYVAYEAG